MISRLYEEADAPALDLGVQGRLRRLDERLRLVWSHWQIDPSTSLPIVTRRGERIYAPAWNLWIWTQESWNYIREYSARRREGEVMATRLAGEAFGHRQVLALERDPFRRVSPSEAARRMLDAKDSWQEKRATGHQERRVDFQRANARRSWDLAVNGKTGRRQARAVSYAGQGRRATPGTVLEDARRDGWEYPPTPKEAECRDAV